MKKITFVFLFLSFCLQAQIKGTITDVSGNPLPFVSIYIENSYIGTTSNELGVYELQVLDGKNTLVFQYIGFKTEKIPFEYVGKALEFNMVLKEENLQLSEVVLQSGENPANGIIRNAIAAKEKNSQKNARFTADFYSKGKFKLKDVPEKFLGQEVGDLDGSLDSTRSGIIYLSETVSKITFEKPNNLKEKIIASKVSGDDNGFSYNTARATRFDFYDNTLNFGTPMISPIANNAFGYYKYKLEGTFYDDQNHLINKIEVIPRRDAEPVFEGYIYIVEDSWEIYAVDLKVKGYRSQQEFMDLMVIKQNYSFNQNNQIWAKNSQSLSIQAGFFGIGFEGGFTYVFNNYNFVEEFDKKTFGREIVSFEAESNKKDSTYWNTFRPVPLTEDESRDYVKKDSLQTLYKSFEYLDSIDRKGNKFKIFDIVSGYSYRNSFKKWSFVYDGIMQIPKFNTVQGWRFNTGFSYIKRDEDSRKYTAIGTKLQYGVSDERLRTTAYINHRFKSKTYSFLQLEGGNKVAQFNPNNPISDLINSVSTLFFRDNYQKLYEKNFARAAFQQELVNGLYLYANTEYSERRSLFNTTDQSFIKKDEKEYTSNNPLDETDYTSGGIVKHNLAKLNLNFRVNFGQKYISRPDGKMNIPNEKYPTLFLGYEKGFAGNEDFYNYDLIMGRLTYYKTLSNKGDFVINFKAGKFFNADGISFVDYKHFNGNQTNVQTSGRYLNVFNLLPYYSNSTNDAYIETHVEHNFNGFIMNKIPLLNLLKTNLIVGYHQIATPNNLPYQEFTVGLDRLGFGKYKILRLDYVRAYNGSSFATDGIMFGLKFLDAFD
uniref:DUF5686 and carboxypeptidase regulatory-like domain-containing protein n=1 Tax=Flavobacterium sp. TaxID=239 RepID=UPI0040493B88